MNSVKANTPPTAIGRVPDVAVGGVLYDLLLWLGVDRDEEELYRLAVVLHIRVPLCGVAHDGVDDERRPVGLQGPVFRVPRHEAVDQLLDCCVRTVAVEVTEARTGALLTFDVEPDDVHSTRVLVFRARGHHVERLERPHGDEVHLLLHPALESRIVAHTAQRRRRDVPMKADAQPEVVGSEVCELLPAHVSSSSCRCGSFRDIPGLIYIIYHKIIYVKIIYVNFSERELESITTDWKYKKSLYIPPVDPGLH